MNVMDLTNALDLDLQVSLIGHSFVIIDDVVSAATVVVVDVFDVVVVVVVVDDDVGADDAYGTGICNWCW